MKNYLLLLGAVLSLATYSGCAHEEAMTSHTSTTRAISPVGVSQETSTSTSTQR